MIAVPSPLKYILQATLLASLSLVLVTVPLAQVYVLTEPPLVLLMGNFLMGMVIFLTGSLLTVSISSYVLRKLSSACTSTVETKPASKLQTLLALLLTIIICAWGSIHARGLHIEFVTVPIKTLHHRLNGTTIVQLSDIHLGPFIGRSRLEYLVHMTNQLKSDIVVITGDLVDSNVDSLWDAVKPLKTLTPKHGVYYTTG